MKDLPSKEHYGFKIHTFTPTSVGNPYMNYPLRFIVTRKSAFCLFYDFSKL